jgi:hypothetical protein
MKKTIAAIFASFAFFVGVPTASASVIVLATLTPDSITTGGTVDFELKLTLTPDAGFSDAFFKGGNVTLFSGNGQQHTFSIPAPGGSTRDFTWEFTYLTAGNYTPSYDGNVTYRDVLFGEVCKTTKKVTTCDIEETGHKDHDLKLGGLFNDPKVVDVVSIAAVPELATWAMMLIGFGGLGLVAYRRSRKPAAALS